MFITRLKSTICILGIISLASNVFAENIDPDNDGSQFAWGENVGWFNFEPCQGPGIHVSADELTGYVWAENIGWINFSPTTYGGVLNDGSGNLSGYAWGENVGWINFNPTYGGVSIDSDGEFEGWAWGENIGWISFDSTKTYNVQVCMVTLEDLAGFISQWLEDGDLPANFDWDSNPVPGNLVDLVDFSIFSSYWLSYCGDDWQL